MNHIRVCFAAILILLLFFVHPAAAQEQGVTKLKVVTTFSILWDMANQIGGDKIELYNIVGPDVDMHDYQLTPQDIAATANADVLIYNGLGFEPWMDKLLSGSGFKGKIVRASTKANLLRLTDDQKRLMKKEHASNPGGHNHNEDEIGEYDPHAWQNLSNARIYATNVSMALTQADRDNEKFYKDNAEKYRAELTELQKWAEQEFRKVPEGDRKMVSTHDGMNYFAKTYRIKLLNPLSISNSDNASANELAEVIKWIEQNRVKALFMENVSDRRIMDQISKETRIAIGGQLYTDSLHNAKDNGDTFASLYRHNVNTVVSAMKP